ncbi:MAG TPA: ribonuclease P protein component [Candidatus Dormibacteraeota bacterium]|nr:ribonuclease P protein component [Candidatus Dormibacteraeota bacterium]
MITAAHRFHGYGSLRGVYQRGQNLRGPLLSLKFNRRDPGRPYRVAVVVSRKVNKSAVTRNRIRRRIYEVVRTTDDRIAPGTDLVFTVFDDKVAALPAAELQASIGELLQKAAQTASQP